MNGGCGGCGGGGGGGQGGYVQTKKPAPWTQAGVDKCNHLTETRYPVHEYQKFTADERQRVFQNRRDRPAPPASVTLIKLSSTISALCDTVVEQHRRMDEDRAVGRDNGKDESVAVDPNRNLSRGTPARGERASGDRG